MRFMAVRHTKPELYRADRWMVVDMEHPEHLPAIKDKTAVEALDFCARLNRGERFWDSTGRETYEEGARRELGRIERTVDKYRRSEGMGRRFILQPPLYGEAARQIVRAVTGMEWDEWVTRRVNGSRRMLDLGTAS